ncbi:MAG TPA: M20/M25/M40 family metallo-hydrolase [Bacteroidales bacterium]|nr:M20/M25/M40 family metallo-hydrolase [Bacteroidales bacterium]
MKKYLFIILMFCTSFAFGQVSNPFYQSVVSNVSYDSILCHLQHFQSLGVKSPGSSALLNTRNWLVSKYQSFGYTSIVQDNFTYQSNTMTNIVVTKTGTLYPNTFLIVSGHYDTKNGTGTNDNGSGVSIILEVARLLANISTNYSVKFINFSGEESGFRGSSHYADDIVQAQGLDILLVFNIDEVGGVAGMANNTIRCESDQSSSFPSVSTNNAASAAYTDTLVTLTQLYSGLNTVITNAYGSDYMPFEYNGEIITGYYEDNESSVVHTSNDNLAHLDTSYVYQIAKAATGSTLYFAGAYDNTTEFTQRRADNDFLIYPNPVTDEIIIRNTSESTETIQIFDMKGCFIMVFQVPGKSENSVDLSQLPAGLYIFEISDGQGDAVGRRMVSKM